MTPGLREVVEQAYGAFAPYTIGSALVVCNCSMCMTNEDERRLAATPLREIPAPLLAEYTNSAHDWNDGQVAREMRYFLPRYLELIASNDPPDNMGLDICLRRLGQAGWRAKWPAEQVAVIDGFFDRLVAASVHRLGLALWPVGWRLEFDLTDVLTMVVTAGGDIGRVLAAWDAATDPPAAIHMAGLRDRVLSESGRTYLVSAYLESHVEAADAIGAFLARPEVDVRLEHAFFRIEDERLQKLVSDAMWR